MMNENEQNMKQVLKIGRAISIISSKKKANTKARKKPPIPQGWIIRRV